MILPTKKNYFLVEASPKHKGLIVWAEGDRGWYWVAVRLSSGAWRWTAKNTVCAIQDDPRKVYDEDDFTKITSKAELFALML